MEMVQGVTIKFLSAAAVHPLHAGFCNSPAADQGLVLLYHVPLQNEKTLDKD